MQSGVFALLKSFLKNCRFCLAVFEFFGEWGTKGEITNHPLSRLRKEVRIWTSLIVPNGKPVALLTVSAKGVEVWSKQRPSWCTPSSAPRGYFFKSVLAGRRTAFYKWPLLCGRRSWRQIFFCGRNGNYPEAVGWRYTRAAGRKTRRCSAVLFLWYERPGDCKAPLICQEALYSTDGQALLSY